MSDHGVFTSLQYWVCWQRSMRCPCTLPLFSDTGVRLNRSPMPWTQMCPAHKPPLRRSVRNIMPVCRLDACRSTNRMQ